MGRIYIFAVILIRNHISNTQTKTAGFGAQLISQPALKLLVAFPMFIELKESGRITQNF